MTNIRDIAKQSGYSVTTVSRYLNQNGYVSEAAAQKIKEVITKLDYVPNSIARDLSIGQTSTIGVVVPHMHHPYFTQLVAGIMEAAFAKQINVTLLQSKYDAQLEIKYLKQLHQKTYDGLIFTSHGISLTEMVKYQKYGPIVCCEDPGEINLLAAYTTRETTYLQAFTHLKKHHFTNIGVMLSRPYELSATSKLTLDCYRQVFDHYPNKHLLQTTTTTYSDGYQGALKYLKLSSQPDFIFTNGDDIAAGVRQCYLDHNHIVPPLMGQENQLASQLMQISTIDHHFKQVGAQAFHLLSSPKIKQVPVTAELIIR